jgi:hypothetical protein
MCINCPDCDKELDEVIDTTYSNYNSGRCYEGQHTGDVYWCDVCEQRYIDDFVNNCVRYWRGE